MQRFQSRIALFLLCSVVCLPAWAQGFDPRPTLLTLIQAFQNCGPPQAYQLLSPQLFQVVSQQTAGQGCYAQIRAAGPVLSADVLDQRQFAIGPLFVVRVTHQAGPVDWFIGFNQATGRVEQLTFQAAMAGMPTIESGPATGSKGPSRPKSPAPKGPEGGTPDPSSSDGCDLYPAMCK